MEARQNAQWAGVDMLRLTSAVSIVICAGLVGGCTSSSGMDGAPSGTDVAASPPSAWRSAVAIHASYEVSRSGRLVARPWLVNESSEELVGVTGYCELRYRVYTDPSRSGAPVWRIEEAPTPVPGVRACPASALLVSLAPGDSLAMPSEVLDDVQRITHGEAGTYYVSAILTLHEPEMSLGELPAGEFTVNGT